MLFLGCLLSGEKMMLNEMRNHVRSNVLHFLYEVEDPKKCELQSIGENPCGFIWNCTVHVQIWLYNLVQIYTDQLIFRQPWPKKIRYSSVDNFPKVYLYWKHWITCFISTFLELRNKGCQLTISPQYTSLVQQLFLFDHLISHTVSG